MAMLAHISGSVAYPFSVAFPVVFGNGASISGKTNRVQTELEQVK